jgi:prevent-host-death family protein
MRPSDVKPITYLKTNAPKLLAAINKTRREVVITQNGEPKAVLVDIESYERTQNALALLRLVNQSEAEIRKGRHLSTGEVRSKLAKAIGK